MAAILNSLAVFKERAKELGLCDEAVAVAITEKIATMGGFGFCTAFIPGTLLKKIPFKSNFVFK